MFASGVLHPTTQSYAKLSKELENIKLELENIKIPSGLLLERVTHKPPCGANVPTGQVGRFSVTVE